LRRKSPRPWDIIQGKRRAFTYILHSQCSTYIACVHKMKICADQSPHDQCDEKVLEQADMLPLRVWENI
jgi:hypothetical protein